MTPEVEHAIRTASNETGVPFELLEAVAWVESRHNPAAVSPVGAQGLFQLMPRTAESLGVEDPFDPLDNARGGALLLSRLHKKYGEWPAALAAYNWGPGHVDQSSRWPDSVGRYIDKVAARYPLLRGSQPTFIATFIRKMIHPFPELRRI